MNANSVSSKESAFTLRYTPARVCQHCDRWTHIGQAEREGKSRAFSVTPLCPEHGYYDTVEDAATPDERKLEHASIERFVVWAQDERGTAQVIGPCPVETIAGYDYHRHNTDWSVRDGYTPKGWLVSYQLNGESNHLHVIYDYLGWAFTLYVDGRWIER